MLWDEIETRERELRDQERLSHQVQAELAPEFNDAHEDLLRVYAGAELDGEAVLSAVARANERFGTVNRHIGQIYRELNAIALQKRGCRLVGPWWAVMTPERRAELQQEARVKAEGWHRALSLAVSRRWEHQVPALAEELADAIGLVWWLEVEPAGGVS